MIFAFTQKHLDTLLSTVSNHLDGVVKLDHPLNVIFTETLADLSNCYENEQYYMDCQPVELRDALHDALQNSYDAPDSEKLGEQDVQTVIEGGWHLVYDRVLDDGANVADLVTMNLFRDLRKIYEDAQAQKAMTYACLALDEFFHIEFGIAPHESTRVLLDMGGVNVKDAVIEVVNAEVVNAEDEK